MKRIAAAAALAIASVAVAPVAAQAAPSTTSSTCHYKVRADTYLYEYTTGSTVNSGFFKRVMAGTRVAGPCAGTSDRRQITDIYAWGKWNPVESSPTDRDYIPTVRLDWLYTA